MGRHAAEGRAALAGRSRRPTAVARVPWGLVFALTACGEGDGGLPGTPDVPDHWYEEGGVDADGGLPPDASVPPRPWVLGHRGYARNHVGNPYPENSLGGARHALEVGADGMEIDVVKTLDDVLVMFHDRDLAADEGLVPKTENCMGPVTQMRWADVEGCRVQSGDPAGGVEPIGTLDALLELGEMKLLLLDVKNDLFELEASAGDPDYQAERTLEVLAELLEAHGRPPHVVLGLYREETRARAQELGMQSCFKYHGHIDGWTSEVLLEKLDAVDDWGACMNYTVFDDVLAAGIRARGLRSLAYINDPYVSREALHALMERLLGLRVGALLTGRVELALELRDALWPQFWPEGAPRGPEGPAPRATRPALSPWPPAFPRSSPR